MSASPPAFKLLIIIKKSHAILLSRLSKRFGIHSSVLQWFHSYPSDCTQYIKVNGTSSDHHFLQLGVPQGSVLGPLLYSFIRLHSETLLGLMVSTSTSTLMTNNSTLHLKALLFLIGIAAFPGWLLVLLILTPECCVISRNWTRTRQRCWSYPLLIDLILPYLPLLYVEKWYPADLKLIT